ncbi:bile salt-activated lipase-like [Mya arenaria]|uniref:bile salt-activated lipase-like n=1 Tax=Mya arenaria TaxID=6604 RepID=UPI0022DFB4F0|nr:bile salt-activated lipase-like [Mya arenaria]
MISVLLACSLVLTIHCADLNVSTPVGVIKGVEATINIEGIKYSFKKYLGIPFAKPPVGDLRWKKPVSYGNLGATTYEAVAYKNTCPQLFLPGNEQVEKEDEDCLYLNIWVPDKSPAPDKAHAVMVFIYGGSFIIGSADMYNGEELVNYGNVILVTLNYRVGPLGFLSTMDEICPGNFGFWDQRLALEWVNDNIGYFGGDSERITIFGESAGAIGVALQSMYPGDNGKIFQRAICESGVGSVSFINYTRDTTYMVNAIAERLNCMARSNAEIITCLRHVPWKKLMEVVMDLNENQTRLEYINFDPVLDNDFIKHDPKELKKLSSDRNTEEVEFFRSIDFMNGFNQYEGGMSLLYFIAGDMDVFKPTFSDFVDLIPGATFVIGEVPIEVVPLIAHEYTDWKDPYNYENIRLQYTHLHGDLQFGFPAVETSLLHAGGSDQNRKSYMFHFLPSPTNRFSITPTWLPGADHGEELAFVFGLQSDPGIKQWELDLSRKMMKYWSNFAKTGNPNAEGQDLLFWPEYTLSKQECMSFDKTMDNDSVKQHFYADKVEFWTNVYPTMIKALEGDRTCPPNDGPVNGVGRSVNRTGHAMFALILLFAYVLH